MIRLFYTSAAIILFFMIAESFEFAQGEDVASKARVPAEWEPQAAIWLQWPGKYEKSFEKAFAAISIITAEYEKLHILCSSERIRKEARESIAAANGNPDHENIVWHLIKNDSAWMRDNGPVYVVQGGRMRIQNWKFNAWGGAFGSDIPYKFDDAVPKRVGEYLDMPVEEVKIVHERGNLEFNGKDAVILNWSTLGDPDRNPAYTKAQAEDDLKERFGVSRVVLIEGIPEGDLTKGHVDGIARFVDSDTVVVAECTEHSICRPGDGRNDAIFDAAAASIRAAGFNVIRDPIEGVARYNGKEFETNYMNWLVGNGFVIMVGFGNSKTDAAAKARVESYFPGRRVHVVEMLQSWASGGGVHCHTNDQPALSAIQ